MLVVFFEQPFVMQQHRQALKHTSLNPTEAFREHCAQRVRQRKQQIIKHLREQGEDVQQQDTIDKLNSILAKEFDNIIYQESLIFNVPVSQLQDMKIQLMAEIEAEWQKEGIIINFNLCKELEQLQVYEEAQQFEDQMYDSSIQAYLAEQNDTNDPMIEGKVAKSHTPIVMCPMCTKHKLLQTKHAILCKCGLKIRTNVDCFSVHCLLTLLYRLMV